MATAKKSPRRRAEHRDVYLELVQAFPLRAIRTEKEAEAAGDILTKLLLSKSDENRDAGEQQYIDALSDLILRYQETAPNRLPKASAVEMLRFLMAEHDMTVTDLGRILGSQPAASMILTNGPKRRSISKSQILQLARHFKVSPILFLDES